MTVSSIPSTGSPVVDQLIAAAQSAIQTSQAAMSTYSVYQINDTVELSPDAQARQAAAQAAAQYATAHGSVGFAAASYAPQIAKLSIDQMLISDFLAVNGLGDGSDAGATGSAKFVPDALRGGFDIYM